MGEQEGMWSRRRFGSGDILPVLRKITDWPVIRAGPSTMEALGQYLFNCTGLESSGKIGKLTTTTKNSIRPHVLERVVHGLLWEQ